MNKSIAVLGLGNYGMSLAKEMYEMGADVLAVDKDAEKIKEISNYCTEAVCIDLLSEEEISGLDLKSMDIVVCAMGRNLAASIMGITVSKEQNVSTVMAKSSSNRMTSILQKVGADKVIIPEAENGVRTARIISSDTFLDFFQVDDNLCMIEMKPRAEWVGHTLAELDIRKQYKVNIVAKQEDAEKKWELINPVEKLSPTCRLLIVLEKSQLTKLTKIRRNE